MPVLNYATAGCVSGLYDAKPVPIPGIPLKFFVRPIARQGGVFVDHPKGFEQPACLVECCNPPEDVEEPQEPNPED